MRNTFGFSMGIVLALISLGSINALTSDSDAYLDLAKFGRMLVWSDDKAPTVIEVRSWKEIPQPVQCVGLQWNEERDVREIRVRFPANFDPGETKIQYWFKKWPYNPPRMPTIEDPLDDIWQGTWLTAEMESKTENGIRIYTFKPLNPAENPKAENLPGVLYRRTLQARVVFAHPVSQIESLHIYSESKIKPLSLRIELGCEEKSPAIWSGRLEIFNGFISSVKSWNFAATDSMQASGEWKAACADKPKGIIAEVSASDPQPSGSNDITVITVKAEAEIAGKKVPRTFAFSTSDLEKGPIYIPDFHAYVTQADDPNLFSTQKYANGKTIRDQIPTEPEQSYERARKEIPPLDPWADQGGNHIYLPVAADASWQKFAVDYSGNFFISKRGTKAKGAELQRLLWEGDRINFQLGTGETPYHREDHQVQVSVLDECLPVVLHRWEREGLKYEEESFATLLSGPLDPESPDRSEQTPAILMVRLKVSNPGSNAKSAYIRLAVDPQENLQIKNEGIFAVSNAKETYKTPRLRFSLFKSEKPHEISIVADKKSNLANGVLSQFSVAAGQSETVDMMIPFVSDIAAADLEKFQTLNYDRERRRVVEYWQNIINKTMQFTTPEPKFNYLSKFTIAHIHISTTKDPKSGLYMVPAASYGYPVFANESCFQVLLLDALGDTATGTKYMKTLIDLQGTRSFPGNYIEPHDGVYHGAKVNDEYDYTAHNYGLDHGTVLWTLANHYFYTRDAEWLEQSLPSMFKAIDWIERQRAATKNLDIHGNQVLEYGLIPAGHLEDNDDWGYWFSVNAYCSAGMLDTAKALQDIKHPEAEKRMEQALAFRNDLRTAIMRAVERAPVVRMRNGTYSPYVPTQLYQRFRNFGRLRMDYYRRYQKPDVAPCFRLSATREVLYGPMILLNLEIFDPQEPIADWILDDWEDNLTLSSSGGFNVHGFTDDKFWFSQGEMVFQSNLQNPVLVYLKRRETPAAIRGLYNNFTACLYPDINTFTEEYRTWSHASGPFYKSPDEARFVNRLRDVLVLESGEDLWLGVGAPRRWLEAKAGIQVERINSIFGPVGYTLQPGNEANTILGRVTLPTVKPPKNLWLYVRTPGKSLEHPIKSVEINGKPWKDFDPQAERIRLPQDEKTLQLQIRY